MLCFKTKPARKLQVTDEFIDAHNLNWNSSSLMETKNVPTEHEKKLKYHENFRVSESFYTFAKPCFSNHCFEQRLAINIYALICVEQIYFQATELN